MPIYHFNYTMNDYETNTILVPEKSHNSYSIALKRAKDYIVKIKSFTGDIEDYDINISWIQN